MAAGGPIVAGAGASRSGGSSPSAEAETTFSSGAGAHARPAAAAEAGPPAAAEAEACPPAAAAAETSPLAAAAGTEAAELIAGASGERARHRRGRLSSRLTCRCTRSRLCSLPSNALCTVHALGVSRSFNNS